MQCPRLRFIWIGKCLLRVGQKQTEELYQDVTIVTVKGSGHWTASENPVDFVDKVIEYISHH